ncbi:iron ABC transporter permease [Lysinibacillus telephonicus]|uniref:Iron ABC transporter permease n=1 Tax=Lysinibacillus telephonicus TaxID=1714840 RepID=A0A3S0JPK8_9BACI|nr:iron ABC transporter permease [Lysinibacillus telephonicus]RTQ92984.1 iron ABC transporter permease [Lysinibacillus telephonicus]
MADKYVIRSKHDKFSLFIYKRNLKAIICLAILSIVAFLFSICLGNVIITPFDVMKTMVGQGTEDQVLILGILRLPRMIVGFLAGMALGVSGAILQGIIRNPLASPDVIGISSGASFTAVTFITYLAGKVSIHWLPFAAFCGAGLVSIIIYLLAWRRGVTSTRLVLIGIGMSAITSALTMLMITISPSASASQAYIWMTGSVYGSSWSNVLILLPWVAVFIPFAFIFSHNIMIQQLGDDIARGLGSPLQYHRAILLMISVALAGSAVAVAGAIGFVGLIAPHIARKLVGSNFRSLILASAFIGGLIVLLADTIGRTAFLPQDVPVGVFTSAVGAPFFIYLLYRNRNK